MMPAENKPPKAGGDVEERLFSAAYAIKIQSDFSP